MGKYRKFLVAVAAMITAAVAQGVVPDKYAGLATVVLAGLGALGVYATPNEPAHPDNV